MRPVRAICQEICVGRKSGGRGLFPFVRAHRHACVAGELREAPAGFILGHAPNDSETADCEAMSATTHTELHIPPSYYAIAR